ncbi:MAG: hypothetical protein KF903_09385 [Dokdonella sp.]|uniref:hypothetical protein n=1 Tax=Dokdonella sp. TaxID=2291710 RepID=UPI0025C4B52A|nr:hypothetical protein [Dokdonella sp.]MBX3701195.1 hypothetical protein [Dokdonella sp.]
MSRIIRTLAITTLCMISGTTFAQSSTGTITLSALRTGWNSDSFALVPVGAIINPANCSTPDGYVSAAPAPGYQTFLSTALTAFALDTSVAVTVHNTACISGRPVLIGINLMH